MAIPTLDYWRGRPAATFAALGLASGALSALWGLQFKLEMLQPLAYVFLLDPGALAIGFFFGMAIAIGFWLSTGRVWALPALLVTTMYAWSFAIHTAIRLQRNKDDDLHLVAASLCAGAVGAGLTHLGCALFAAELRRPWRIALTCAVGAAAGMLLYLYHRRYVDERLLYVVWQPLVAFCIGSGLGRRTETA